MLVLGYVSLRKGQKSPAGSIFFLSKKFKIIEEEIQWPRKNFDGKHR